MKLPSAEDLSKELIVEFNAYRGEGGVRSEHDEKRDARVLRNYAHAFRHGVKEGKITREMSPEESHGVAVKFVPSWVLIYLAKEVGFWLAKKLFTRLFLSDDRIGAAPKGEQECPDQS